MSTHWCPGVTKLVTPRAEDTRWEKQGLWSSLGHCRPRQRPRLDEPASSTGPILGNRYVRSRGFIVSEPRETHPRSEIADVPTSPCPPFGIRILTLQLNYVAGYRSPPLPLRTDPQPLLCHCLMKIGMKISPVRFVKSHSEDEPKN